MAKCACNCDTDIFYVGKCYHCAYNLRCPSREASCTQEPKTAVAPLPPELEKEVKEAQSAAKKVLKEIRDVEKKLVRKK